jgi:hypothetical protein
MRYRSLLAVDGDPPSVTLSEGLLPDHALTQVGGTIVFAGPAPWPGNHDLLVDEDGRAGGQSSLGKNCAVCRSARDSA